MFKNTNKKIAVLGLAATMCGTQGLVANAQYSGPRYRINEASYLDITCPCEVEHTAPGGSIRVTGNAMIRTEGNNQITVGENGHIYSLSAHNIDHEGNGGANFDICDIIVSGFENEGQSARNVTVNNANFLIPAPGITMRLQDGTIFDIGATAQETLENLQRAIEQPEQLLGIQNAVEQEMQERQDNFPNAMEMQAEIVNPQNTMEQSQYPLNMLNVGYGNLARRVITIELTHCTSLTQDDIDKMSNEDVMRLYNKLLAEGTAHDLAMHFKGLKLL